MAVETIGRYQVHLFAYELPRQGKWDAFLSIYRFDDALKDFVCIVEKENVAQAAWNDYNAAIEAARTRAKVLIEELDH